MATLTATTREVIQYWERRRLIYNAVLSLIVVAGFALAWPRSLSWFSAPALPTLVQAAVLANVVYCAAYVVEWLLHLTPYREAWRRRRFLLFIAGVGLASFLTSAVVFVIVLGPLDNH